MKGFPWQVCGAARLHPPHACPETVTGLSLPVLPEVDRVVRERNEIVYALQQIMDAGVRVFAMYASGFGLATDRQDLERR